MKVLCPLRSSAYLLGSKEGPSVESFGMRLPLDSMVFFPPKINLLSALPGKEKVKSPPAGLWRLNPAKESQSYSHDMILTASHSLSNVIVEESWTLLSRQEKGRIKFPTSTPRLHRSVKGLILIGVMMVLPY